MDYKKRIFLVLTLLFYKVSCAQITVASSFEEDDTKNISFFEKNILLA